MGLLRFLFSRGADKTREAMRTAYRSHRRRAQKGEFATDFSPHVAGLIGAMGTRLAANGISVTPTAIWHEIAPFAMIHDEEVGAAALAEYAVYVERTVDTKLPGLKETINSWLRRASPDAEMMKLVTNPLAQDCRWWGLLERDVIEKIEKIRSARSDLY